MKKQISFFSIVLFLSLSFVSFGQYDAYPSALDEPVDLNKQKTYVVQMGNSVFDDKLKAVMDEKWKYAKPQYITSVEFQAKEKKKEVMIYIRIASYKYASVSYRAFEVGSHTRSKSVPDNTNYVFPFDYTKYDDGKESGSDVSLEYFATKLNTIITSFCYHADKFMEIGQRKYTGTVVNIWDSKPLTTKTLLVDKELFVNTDITEAAIKESYSGKYEVVDGAKAEELSKSADKDKYARLFVSSYPLKWDVIIIDLSTGVILGKIAEASNLTSQFKQRIEDKDVKKALGKFSKKMN